MIVNPKATSLQLPEELQPALTVDGVSLLGWDQLSVSIGLEQAARSFSFVAAARDQDKLNPLQIPEQATALVHLGPDRVLTGRVDIMTADADKDSHVVQVVGRSATRDLVDCSSTVGSGDWSKASLEAIAREVCAEWGIGVVVTPGTDLGDPPRKVKRTLGEKGYALLERLCRERSILLRDDTRGRLVMTQPGAQPPRAHTALVEGENLIAFGSKFDASKRYSEITIKGQTVRDSSTGPTAVGSSASATDAGVRGSRRLVLTHEKRADAARCRTRAVHEVATRYGQAMEFHCVVQGWRQGDGSLWEPGLLVPVAAPSVMVRGELILVDVQMTMDADGGGLTAMTLRPPELYDLLEPFKPPKRRRSKRRSGGAGVPELDAAAQAYQAQKAKEASGQ